MFFNNSGFISLLTVANSVFPVQLPFSSNVGICFIPPLSNLSIAAALTNGSLDCKPTYAGPIFSNNDLSLDLLVPNVPTTFLP